MDRLEALLGELMDRHDIARRDVIGHSDMAPGRKGDPGPHFDWGRLAAKGLAYDPPTAGSEAGDFDADLTAIGYPVATAEDRLAAFRLRFRQGAEGPLTEMDRRLARAIAIDLAGSAS